MTTVVEVEVVEVEVDVVEVEVVAGGGCVVVVATPTDATTGSNRGGGGVLPCRCKRVETRYDPAVNVSKTISTITTARTDETIRPVPVSAPFTTPTLWKRYRAALVASGMSGGSLVGDRRKNAGGLTRCAQDPHNGPARIRIDRGHQRRAAPSAPRDDPAPEVHPFT